MVLGWDNIIKLQRKLGLWPVAHSAEEAEVEVVGAAEVEVCPFQCEPHKLAYAPRI